MSVIFHPIAAYGRDRQPIENIKPNVRVKFEECPSPLILSIDIKIFGKFEENACVLVTFFFKRFSNKNTPLNYNLIDNAQKY